ncbi:uncharacterized protein N7518_004669 [Penicillium psychrosexuale]|uniref:uncharacterized protein n=1 Tax=Penicillium psychrosexuale TaxID=1002107 RepID=UPI002545BA05|nr:uncharacterized protein N7518_004669 [Penicillium psychrosexuale]KAJ5796129.1 hypothetical protein N7518_004669 [Penicillium psychrosexuale]
MARKQLIYEIGLFRSSTKNKDTQLNVSNKRFKIDLFASGFESSSTLLAEYLRHVRRQEPEWIPDEAEIDDDGEFEDPLEEMHDWVLQPFLSIFHEIAPLDPSQKYTLDDCLFAEEFHYTVQVVEEKLVPVYLSNTKRMQNDLIGTCLPPSVDYSIFPVYHPKEVQVPISADSAALPGIPRKVFIHGRPQPSFFKLVYWGDAGILTREILTYSKIHMAKFDPPILTSQLEGLIQDDNGYVMGLLLSYIDCGGATLNCIDGHDPKYSELRQKCFDQVSHTLQHFHLHHIIWGDAKAANVLIDVNEDAYLIDFEGGYTKGWVEKEKSDSIEGDLQGLQHNKRRLFE